MHPAVLVAFAFAVLIGAAFALHRGAAAPASKANAQSLSQAQSTMPVPQFGVNIGDYSNCMNGYTPDNSLGDITSGLWTPIGGGLETGVAGSGYAGGGFGAGDCIQAGMVTNASNTYTEDFRVGIRIAPGLANGSTGHASNGSTVNTQCNWTGDNGDWQFTPWASQGGGTSAFSVVPPSDTWGAECVQIEVQTSTLPAGEYIKGPSFGITISHNGNPDNSDDTAAITSQTAATCYLDSARASWDSNPPEPSCSLLNIGNGGNFWSAQVSLSVNSLNAVPVGSNIPSSTGALATVTQGSDGNPLGITLKNTGSIPWSSYFTPAEAAGTSKGTCNYDYDGQGINDAPASGSAKGSSCSTSVSLTSDAYSLVHQPSSFSASPETIPLSYQNVVQTITYTPSSTVTISEPCPSGAKGALMFNDTGGTFSSFIHAAYAAAPTGPGGTCPTVAHIPEEWDVSYSGGGYSSTIAPGSSFTFALASLSAPSATGTYTEQWQMEQDGVPFGTPFTTPITVGMPGGTGTITVASLDSQDQNVAITSTWHFQSVYASNDPCGHEEQQDCPAASAATYTNVNPDNYTILPDTVVPSSSYQSPGGFAFDSIERVPIAVKPESAFGRILAFAGDLISTAEAYDASPPGHPQEQQVVPGGTASFIILWDPIANLSLDNSTWTPTAVVGGGPVTDPIAVSNDGSPGSTLTWSATSDSKWLSVSPTSTDSGLAQHASDNVMVTANPSGLNAGTYTGHITFSGESSFGKLPPGVAISQTFTVTLTVNNNHCPGDNCPLTPTVSITPATSAITLGQSQELTITSANVTSCTGSGDWSGSEPCNGTVTVIPGTTGTFTYIVTATDAGGNAKATATVTVSNSCSGSGCKSSAPSCSLSAEPSSVVVPESSNLTYSCANVDVNRCTMTGGQFSAQWGGTPLTGFSGTSVQGSVSATPDQATSYAITCYGIGKYAGTEATATTTVTVTNPTLYEINP